MKVILTSKIKTLGNIGDVKIVADGYGKNYLLPKKLAIIYTENNYKAFEEKKKILEADDLKSKEKAILVKDKIEKKELILLEAAGDNDRLYGSVTSLKLANFINNILKEKVLVKNNIFIKEPIKTLGKFTIIFDLHPEISLEKEIIVARSKEEAEKIKKGEFIKRDEKKSLQDDKIENNKEQKIENK